MGISQYSGLIAGFHKVLSAVALVLALAGGAFLLAGPALADPVISQALPLNVLPLPAQDLSRAAVAGESEALGPHTGTISGDTSSSQPTVLDQASADQEVQSAVQDEESRMVAQAAGSSSSQQQIDLAPVKLPERSSAISNFDTFKMGALYRLPARMFFNGTVENSLRLETNVFQTAKRNRADMIYRVLPNITIGYALTKTTRVSANYFFFRDQYTRNNSILSRNIHSVGFRVDQDFPISEKTTITASFFARELFLTKSTPLNDLLPSVSIVRRVGDRSAIYGSVLGQIRFRNVLKQFQEGDQFYSMGFVHRTPRFSFLADNTFITNFGNRNLRGGPNNQLFVITLEGGYKVHPKLPITAFVRAEPIFNMGANQAIGFAGFNMRVFGGLRMEVNKPSIFPVKLKRS